MHVILNFNLSPPSLIISRISKNLCFVRNFVLENFEMFWRLGNISKYFKNISKYFKYISGVVVIAKACDTKFPSVSLYF